MSLQPTLKENAYQPTHAELSKGVLLHFFVNLALSADVVDPLNEAGLGRPHHRILVFAAYDPGITINELLAVMRVSRQNLRMPIKTLQEKGYLVVKRSDADARQRQLYVRPAGRRLLDRLKKIQFQRLERAFIEKGPTATQGFLEVQAAMVDPTDASLLAILQETF